MVYYTYVYYESNSDGKYGEYYNWLLISPDRNTANTLYRILLDKKSYKRVDGKDILFKNISRISSQIWSYDTADGEEFHYLGRALSGRPDVASKNPDYASVLGKVRVYWLGYYDARGWKVIPELDPFDSDQLSGYSFFVRRRGSPAVNWFFEQEDGTIRPTEGLWRTRFIITVKKSADDEKIPIIDDDEVKIEVVENSWSEKRRRVGIKEDGALAVDVGEKWFKFSDFRSNFLTKSGTPRTVAWSKNPGRAESYELYDGVKVDY